MFDRPQRQGLAFDRGSVRTYDQDGRLHVEISNISKANVCPYYGWEIPDGEALGLEPKRVYMLLRAAEELEKGAKTFNNIPILTDHVPVSASSPQKEMVIGSTGTDAQFQAPYLKNSLVFWDQEAIDDIESGDRLELSSAYRYDADMTPGVFEGVSYDGVMRNIRGNHVALVPEGRAGSDVIVGDSKLQESEMVPHPLSRKASLAKGALLVFLPKLLAADARPTLSKDLNKILTGVASDNWRVRKAQIATAIKPKLAKDADIGALVKLLDNLDGDEPMDSDVGMDMEEAPGLVRENENAMAQPEGKEGEDAPPGGDPIETCLAGIKALLEKALGRTPAMDNPPPSPGTPAPPAPAAPAGEKPLDDPKEPRGPMEEAKTPMSKGAMDAAIAKAKAEATAETMKKIREIVEAESVVAPYVGKLAVAFDSASDVYRAALTALQVDIEGVHPSAYRAILMAQPKPGATLRLASDHATAVPQDLASRFPDFNRVRTLG